MLKQKYFIDSHKGLTPLFIIFLIFRYNQWDNINAMLYLSLHGTYGLLWITKSYIYPDKQWESKTPLWYGFVIWIGLSLYWISPYIITTGNHFLPMDIKSDVFFIGCCVILYIFGIFLHFTSDMQKFIYLKLKPGHLITDYMFQNNRNTNYFSSQYKQ